MSKEINQKLIRALQGREPQAVISSVELAIRLIGVPI